MKYKLISRTFDSVGEASNYLAKLYGQHDHARCISWPTFTESGKYTFEVSDNPHPSLIPSVHHKMDVRENKQN